MIEVQLETLNDLENRRRELVESIQSIDAQLADPEKLDPEGNRMSATDYESWRHRAFNAKKHMLSELREINTRLREERSAKANSRLDAIEEKLDRVLTHLDAAAA